MNPLQQQQSMPPINPFLRASTTSTGLGPASPSSTITPRTPQSSSASSGNNNPKAPPNTPLPHNVDICITCVTDKPPQLPLREELPSLGIEVVYNAAGVGVASSQQQAKQLVKKFKADNAHKDMTKRRWFPPSPKKLQQTIEQRKSQEEELKIPTAVSYEKYEQGLWSHTHSQEEEEEEENDMDNQSQMSAKSKSSLGEKRKFNNSGVVWKKRKENDLATSAAANWDKLSLGHDSEGSPSDSQSSSLNSPPNNNFPPQQPPNTPLTLSPQQQQLQISPASANTSNSGGVGILSNVFKAFSKDNPPSISEEDEDEEEEESQTNDSGSHTQSHSGAGDQSSTSYSTDEDVVEDNNNMKSDSFQMGQSARGRTPTSRRRNNTPVTNNQSNHNNNNMMMTPTSTHPSTPTTLSKQPTPSNSNQHTTPTSRDPSSLSTHFTPDHTNITGDGAANNNVQVKAANDTIAQTYLPGLSKMSTPSSGGGGGHYPQDGEAQLESHSPAAADGNRSVSSHSTTTSNRKQDPPTHQSPHDNEDGNNDNNNAEASPKSKKRTPYQEDPQLNEAFAAFRLTDISNARSKDAMEDAYNQMGPAATTTTATAKSPTSNTTHSNHTNTQQTNSPSSTTWMNSAKLAFENVAAEVYKQATGNTSSGGNNQHLQQATSNNNSPTAKSQHQQQQALVSPTSTLTSANGHQQQQPFYFTILPNSPSNPSSPNGFPSSPPKSQHQHHSNNKSSNRFPNDPHVEVHVRPDGSQATVASSIGIKSVTAFFEALNQPKTPVDSIQRMLRVCPGLVKVKPQTQLYQGRLGLHVVCARGFPKRVNGRTSSTSLAKQLVEDVTQLKRLIQLLVDANRGACTVLDAKGDLPAHLLARNLMEWEAQWYEKVYEKVATDQDNAAAITQLYQAMSQCIEIVLHPLAVFCSTNSSGNAAAPGTSNASSLCRATGSIGLLLPVHIASIFTASVPTLRRLLEQDPMAATVPCNLGKLRTFIPDHSLPLELHDKLSTDFPKWEIGAEARKSKAIATASGGQLVLEDYMRRSDLLFAFHPTNAKFHIDKQRLTRLQAKIIDEACQLITPHHPNGELQQLSIAVQRLWIWMCTFEDNANGMQLQAPYVSIVERIVEAVPASVIPHLTQIKTPLNKPVLQVAAPEVQTLLREKLEEYQTTQASKLEQMVAQAVTTPSSKNSIAGDAFSYANDTQTTGTTNDSTCLSLKGKGYVGVLCRTLFNVSEDTFPTSFILLPYKLTKNEHGKLGIDKKSSAATAVKFAECLLKLTDPKTILYYLEQKSVQHSSQRISSESDDESSFRVQAQRNFREMEDALIRLYEGGKGYLYLIDELIGLPIVPASSTSLYPIEMTSPEKIVRKVLPLMLTGMILMRGEKALSVLVNVLLDKTVKHVSSNWVDAAREIIAYLYSQQDNRSDTSLPGLDALLEELRAFVSNNSSIKSTSSASDPKEWEVELSILRMVVQMNDSKHSFAGLKAKRDEPGTVLWTKHKIEEEMTEDQSKSTGSKHLGHSGTHSHEDPPGREAAASYDGSSSKFTSSRDGISSISETRPSEDDVSAAISSIMSKTGRNSPRGTTNKKQKDIEKLRFQTTMNDNASADPDGASLDEADSNLDGEELAGVKILLDAEDGPSLLDQDCTTDDEGSDSQIKDKYKSIFSKDEASEEIDAEKKAYTKESPKRKATTEEVAGASPGLQRKRSKDVGDDFGTDTEDESVKRRSHRSLLSEDFSEGSFQIEQEMFEIESRQDQYSLASAEFSNGERSRDRTYDEAHIEEISHSGNKSAYSTDSNSYARQDSPAHDFVRDYEREMRELEDYTINRLASSPYGTPSSFGDLKPSSPMKSLTSPKSNFSAGSSRNIQPAKEVFESRDSDENISRERIPRGRENLPRKNMTFGEMRDRLTDQALKIDCLQTTLENIKIREDKLLSRGEMLQEFLRDLADQSENMKMESEKKAKKVQTRLVDLEDRILCSEIDAQHIAFSTYAVEDEVESMAEEEYKRELYHIIAKQVKQQYGLDEAIGRSATMERLRAGGLDDSDISSNVGYDSSLYALDGYSNSDDMVSSERALDGYPYESTIVPKYAEERPPSHGFDMSRLLRSASVDERSIEYEMGLAMFGTLEEADNFRGNSLDVYERMRSEYHSHLTPPPAAIALTQDDASSTENGYSSAGEYVDMNSVEGDGLDWVKMSARQFDIQQTFRQQ